MPLKPKHRREIRDLLRVLYDDKLWQPRHTDQLLDIIRVARTDVAEEVESSIARDAATARAANRKIQNELRIKMREVDQLRDNVKDLHAKVYTVLEALIDLPMLKCRVEDPETGEWTIDPSLISDKDAKIALQAINAVLKVSGAFAPTKLEVEGGKGKAFDLLDAIEIK